MQTRGFQSEIPEEVRGRIVEHALKHIKADKPNWVVFYPDGEIKRVEDEGRTLVTTMQGLKKKVYAILDDFGSVEALKENMGRYAPPNLNTRYVVTFLLAEEY